MMKLSKGNNFNHGAAKKSGFKGKKHKHQEPRQVKLFIKSSGDKWYNELACAQGAPEILEKVDKSRWKETNVIKTKAEHLLQTETENYRKTIQGEGRKNDFQWMTKIMKSGTLSDRMAAFTVRIQDSPIHNLSVLQQLVSMIKIQGKQMCLQAADTVKELFLEDLLPPSRKLINFELRPLESLSKASEKELLVWAFEDALKQQYAIFVNSLKLMSSDTVDKLRAKSISIIEELLGKHPEQEQLLLELLVNKLGDPVRKVASKSLFHLNKLLRIHPRMKMVIVQEVERLLFRPNISKRAQYYGICFLNAIDLEDEHPKLASKMINVYLAFFKGCIKTGEIDSRLMSALLTGINRSFSLAKSYGFDFEENVNTLYKIIQLSKFNVGVQALSILFQVTDISGNPGQADRYYRVLYKHLLNPEFAITSHTVEFMNLIFKSMKADAVLNRVISFSKRLLQIAMHVPPNLSCAILFLISEVSKYQKNIILLGKGPNKVEYVDESENEEISVQPSEADISALKEFVKTSNVTLGDTSHQKNIRTSDNKSELGVTNAKPKPHKELSANEQIDIKEEKPDAHFRSRTEYDASARNPAYSGAELTLSYELIPLIYHFHPSVALFAQTLLESKKVRYDGNPLKDFTVSRFLERFIYKNPKSSKNKTHRKYEPSGLRNIPVNSEEYLSSSDAKIPPEEMFFYKYFKDKKSKTKVATDADESSDVESVGDDEFDDLMNDYFKTDTFKSEELSEDDDLDFAVVKQKTKGKGKKKQGEGEDEMEDSEIDEKQSGSDDEGDDDADDFVELDGDVDGSDNNEEDFDDMELSEDDAGEVFEIDDLGEDSEDNMLDAKKSLKKKRKLDGDSMFAPAEEFSEMLESNADDIYAGSHTLINKDKAASKQLQWETDRDRWVKGFKKSSKTKTSGGSKKRRKKT